MTIEKAIRLAKDLRTVSFATASERDEAVRTVCGSHHAMMKMSATELRAIIDYLYITYVKERSED